MKRLISLLAALLLLISAAQAEVETIDLENMTLDELNALNNRVQEAIISAYISETDGEYSATREQPALIGAAARYDGSCYLNTAVTDLTVVEVIRGDAAWQKVYAWHNYNEKPAADEEYILVKVRAEAIAARNNEQAEVYDYDFTFVSAEGMEYEYVYAAGVDQELTAVYEGAGSEGWAGTAHLCTEGKNRPVEYAARLCTGSVLWLFAHLPSFPAELSAEIWYYTNRVMSVELCRAQDSACFLL